MPITSYIYKLILNIWEILPAKLFFANALKLLKIPNNKFYKDFKFKGIFTVKITGNYSFKMINPGDATIENEIFWKGLNKSWEQTSLTLWFELIKDADIIFDVGANTGIYSLTAATLNPNAKIFAFEPSKNTFLRLNENILINQFNQIKSFQIAVSDHKGYEEFFDFTFDNQYSASLENNFSKTVAPELLDKYNVDVNTIQNIFIEQGLAKIDVMKIDVELHEPEVLNGMIEILDKYKPTLLIEILNNDIAHQIEATLSPFGYLYFSIEEGKMPEKVGHLSPSSGFNFLICQAVVAQKIRLIA